MFGFHVSLFGSTFFFFSLSLSSCWGYSPAASTGNPGQYKDFNKTAADLLQKVFPKKTGANTWGLELELHPTRQTAFGGKVTSVGGVSTGEVFGEFVLPDFGITNKILFRTDKVTLSVVPAGLPF